MNEMVNPHKTNQHSRPWNGRYEDEALVSGKGMYSGDVRGDALAAFFLRSPHARAPNAAPPRS